MAGPVEWYSPDNHTCSFMSQPFIETVCRNQTTAILHRLTECRFGGGSLRSGVNQTSGAGDVLRPGWNQSPPHQRQHATWFLRMLADDRNWLCGSDAVAGSPVIRIRQIGSEGCNSGFW